MKKYLLLFLSLIFLASPIMAQTYDLIEVTPKVLKHIQMRQDRFSEINELKKFGDVGEDRNGYLKAFSARADELVRRENDDRKFIYMEIIRQNSLPHSELSKVEAVFAEVQREKAAIGTLIQNPNGDWIKKDS